MKSTSVATLDVEIGMLVIGAPISANKVQNVTIIVAINLMTANHTLFPERPSA